jgi:hypothetical protein
MALFEEQITDTLTTDAPSIKYEGDQGPQSPQDERMAQLKEEYMQYVFEMKGIGEPIMSFEEWYQAVYEASKMGVDAGQQPQPQLQQPQPQMRQPVAYGGIMDLGGRRRYGWGSKIKSRIRKLIPNEAAEIAVKAAPFVAPFNPIAAGLMSGIGGFDQHGSISKGLKSGLINYAGGQLARGIGGGLGNLQGASLKTLPGQSGFGSYFSSPIQSGGGLGKMFADKFTTAGGSLAKDGGNKFTQFTKEVLNPADTKASIKAAKAIGKKGTGLDLLDKFSGKGMGLAAILGASAAAGLYTKKNPGDVSAKVNRGKGMDLEGIRAEVIEAFKDPTGKKLEEIRIKYPYLGAKETKNVGIMAEGGRIGYDNGGDVDTPWWKFWGGAADPEQPTEDTTMVGETITKINERALATARAAQEAGIPLNETQKQIIRQAEEQGLAYGGRIGYQDGGNVFELLQKELEGTITPEELELLEQLIKERGKDSLPFAQGGRIGYADGTEWTADAGRFGEDPDFSKLVDDAVIREENKYWQQGKEPPMFLGDKLRMQMWHDYKTGAMGPAFKAQGGRIGAQEGGLMDLGGMEKDYRNDGGFVPLGEEEKADDVPARLSKNEFVFTADAVRGAGGGDIDKGAEIMENIMKNLEQGGRISEETQGLGGAQEMFDVSERLSEVV